jgi:uncharacterized protein
MRFFAKTTAVFLLALLAIPLAYAAFEVPTAPDGYIYDEAQIISDTTEATLETQLQTLDQETSTQIAVVTLSTLQGYTIEEAALTIGRDWGVGQEEFNNGLVLLIAPNEREIRIEVGYGLEGAITDLQSSQIITTITPYLEEADYDSASTQALSYLESLARGEEFATEELEQAVLESQYETDPIGLIIFLIFLFPFLKFFFIWLADSKSWWIGGVIGAFLGIIATASFLGLGIGLVAGLALDFVLSKYFYKKIKPPKGGGPGFWFGGGRGGSGGSSSGGGGGGFGGFGGGSFGGGGASGKW